MRGIAIVAGGEGEEDAMTPTDTINVKKRVQVFYDVHVLLDGKWREFAVGNQTHNGAEEIIRYQRGKDNPSKFCKTAAYRIVRRTVSEEYGEAILP